jgi:2-methylcitrate dehydratase PrpD
LEEFTEEAIRDPIVLAMANKVHYELDPTIDYPRHFSGHVRVKLDDGAIIEENQPHPRGGLEQPLPPDEIEAKFRANARLALSRERAELVMAAVKRLEELPAIGALSDLLCSD